MSDVRPRLSTVLSDRYRLEREIGSGGIGAERLLAEIKRTANLQHPTSCRCSTREQPSRSSST